MLKRLWCVYNPEACSLGKRQAINSILFVRLLVLKEIVRREKNETNT